MKMAAGRWGPLCALLLMAMMGVRGDVPLEELSEIQNKALQLVMETFHKRNGPKNGFHLSSVETESEYELDDGIFVSLEMTLRQTKCRREDWANPGCKPMRDGKSYSCVGCFKLEFPHQKVLSKYIHCVPPNRATQERIVNMRKENCKSLRKPKHPPVYNVGSVSFLRSLPSGN